MKQICVTSRVQWRAWLAENHDTEKGGVWLVFFKKQSGKASLAYEEAVEEALCFGWIDSIVKRIDDEKYCLKFTPRKNRSGWSDSNKKRVEKLIKEGRMTEFGLAKIETAKRSGHWGRNPRPVINLDVPLELSEALEGNKEANNLFDSLAPTDRKHFIAWIVMAKREETKAKRLKESMILLARGEKLGLK